jgi:microcystin-dependent protein
MWCIKAWNAPVNQGNIDVAALVKEVSRLGSAVPVGAVMAFPTGIVPPGFLELDGSVQSTSTYPDLANYLGTTYSKGNEGTGNFRLPESRGEFLRGWDHGRGVDADRSMGSWQTGTLVSYDTSVGGSGIQAPRTTAASADTIASFGADAAGAGLYPGVAESGVPSTAAPLGFASVYGSARPRNVAVMWCIKAWNAPVNQGSIDVAALAPLAQQATEIKQGTAKLATQVLTDAGADDTTIVTPKKLRWGFQILKEINGYIIFPSWLGGLIIQWGRVSGNGGTDIATAFPIAFPNAMYSLNATLNYTPGSAVNGYVDVGVSSLTSFYGKHTFPGVTVFHWVAVGS